MSTQAIIFDLDGTLAESKQPLDAEMAALLRALVDQGHVLAIMSGGSFDQYTHQALPYLGFTTPQYEKLYLLPTSGAALYRYTDGEWREVYNHRLSADEKEAIIVALARSAQYNKITPEKTYGEQIEDRGAQITYSALGQLAPLSEKETWDPDQAKRKKIVATFSEQLPQFDIHIGGMTSIDVTQKDIDKTYGVEQFSQLLSLPIASMIYVGDALYPGGNDEPVRRSGIECVAVKGVEDTKTWIRHFISQGE